MTECEFLFAVLAKKHNAVIRKIRKIPPWEWGEEFLELEPQMLQHNKSRDAKQKTRTPAIKADVLVFCLATPY